MSTGSSAFTTVPRRSRDNASSSSNWRDSAPAEKPASAPPRHSGKGKRKEDDQVVSRPVVYAEGGSRLFKNHYQNDKSFRGEGIPGTLFIFRHGVKEYSNSWGYDSPLVPLQKTLDAMLAPGMFPALVHLSNPVTNVFVSPYLRTRQTYEKVSAALEKAEPNVHICFSVSEYLGNEGRKNRTSLPVPFHEDTQRHMKAVSFSPNIHESFEDFVKRVADFTEEELIPRILSGESLVVFTHGLTVEWISKTLFERFHPERKRELNAIHSPPMGVMTAFLPSFFLSTPTL